MYKELVLVCVGRLNKRQLGPWAYGPICLYMASFLSGRAQQTFDHDRAYTRLETVGMFDREMVCVLLTDFNLTIVNYNCSIHQTDKLNN